VYVKKTVARGHSAVRVVFLGVVAVERETNNNERPVKCSNSSYISTYAARTRRRSANFSRRFHRYPRRLFEYRPDHGSRNSHVRAERTLFVPVKRDGNGRESLLTSIYAESVHNPGAVRQFRSFVLYTRTRPSNRRKNDSFRRSSTKTLPGNTNKPSKIKNEKSVRLHVSRIIGQ